MPYVRDKVRRELLQMKQIIEKIDLQICIHEPLFLTERVVEHIKDVKDGLFEIDQWTKLDWKGEREKPD